MSMQVGGANPLQVGARVTVGKKPGTVRFIGATKFAAGEWFGVELDDSSGKNDGSHDGVTYFTCPADCGVFVRKLQVKPLVDPSAASVSSASRRSSLSSSTSSTASSRRTSLSASSSATSSMSRRSSVSGTSSGTATSRRSSLTGTKTSLSKPKTSAASAAAGPPEDEPSILDSSVQDASLADVLSAAELSMAGDHQRDSDVTNNSSALAASVTSDAIAEEGDGDGEGDEGDSNKLSSSTNKLSSSPAPAAPSTPSSNANSSTSSAPGSGGSSDGGSGQKKKAAPWMVKKSPPRSSSNNSPSPSGSAAAAPTAARSSPSLPLASSPASSQGGSPGASSRASLGGGSSPPPIAPGQSTSPAAAAAAAADGHFASSENAETTKIEVARLREQVTKLTKALTASEAKVERESAGRAAAQQAAASAQSAAEAAHATATKAKATAAAAQAEAKEALAEAARADEHGGQRAWAAYDAEIAGLQGQLAQQARDLATLRQERDHARGDAEKASERAETASKLQASAEAAMSIAKEEAHVAQKALAAAKTASARRRSRGASSGDGGEDDFDDDNDGDNAIGGGAGNNRSSRSGRNSSSGGSAGAAAAGELQAQLAIALESQAAEAKAAKDWAKKCAKLKEAMAAALAAQEQAELNKEEVDIRVEELELEVETLKEQAELEQQLRQSGISRRAGTNGDSALENDNEAAIAQGGDEDGGDTAAAEVAALAAERDSLADLLRQVHASAAANEKGLNEELATASAAAAANAHAAARAEVVETALAEMEERAKELEARLEEGAGSEAAAEELAEALAEAKAALQAAKKDAASRREALVLSEEHVELLEETEELLRDELRHAKQAAMDSETESASLRASLTGQAQEVAQVRRDLTRTSAELADVRRRRDEATAQLQQLTSSQQGSSSNRSSSKSRSNFQRSCNELGAQLARSEQSRKLREAEVRCARLQAMLPPDLLQQAAMDFNRRYGDSSGAAAATATSEEAGGEGKDSAVVASEEEILDGEVALARCVSKVAALRNSLGRRASSSLAHALATRQHLATAQADLARAKRAALASAALEARRSSSNKSSQGINSGSGLDAKKLKALKVSDLRAELDRRSLSTSGLKADLVARLTTALEQEDRAAQEEEENAKAAAAVEGADDEFEDCLPDAGDEEVEGSATYGSPGSSTNITNLSVDKAEVNLAAAQAAATAAARAAATWVSESGNSSGGGNQRSTTTGAASSTSSSVVGHEFPWLLRGGFTCRVLLHLVTSEEEQGHTSGGGGAAAAATAVGTVAAEARATVRRFEACVDALASASTAMVNSSDGDVGSAAEKEAAMLEASHPQAPPNLQEVCSADRLEGAVLALERFLSVNWPNAMNNTSATSSAAAFSAASGGDASAGGVPALQGLLQLHSLLDHTLATTLTAAAAAGSVAEGTVNNAGSSGVSTSILSNACSFLEDCASLVRAVEGRAAPASPELGDWGSSNDSGDDDNDSPTSASTWTLAPLSDSMTATVAALFEGVSSVAQTMSAAPDDASPSSSSEISSVLSDLQTKALDAARAATIASSNNSGDDSSGGARLLDERMVWRAVSAYGRLPTLGASSSSMGTATSGRLENNNNAAAATAAAAASSNSSGNLGDMSGPPAVVRAQACRAFVSSAVACGPELRLTKQALDNAVGAKAAHDRELKAALAQRDKASKQLAEAQTQLQKQLKSAVDAAAAIEHQGTDANDGETSRTSVATLAAEKAALEKELSKLTDDFLALQRQQSAKAAQGPPPLPPPPAGKAGSQQLPPPPVPPPPRAVAAAAGTASGKAASSGAATKDFFAALGEAKLPNARAAATSGLTAAASERKGSCDVRSHGSASRSSSGVVLGLAATGGDAGALLEANALEAALQRARAEAAHWRQAARRTQASGWLDLKPLPVLTGLGSSPSPSSNSVSSGDASVLPDGADKSISAEASSTEGQIVDSAAPTRAAALASVKALEIATMQRQALSPLIRLSPRGSSRADPVDLASPSSSSPQEGAKAANTPQQKQQHCPSARAQMLGLQADVARLVAEHRATCHAASTALRLTGESKHNSGRRSANMHGDFGTLPSLLKQPVSNTNANQTPAQEAAGLCKARLTFGSRSSVQGLDQSNTHVAVSKHELLRITAVLTEMA